MDLSEYAIRMAHHIVHTSVNGLRSPIAWAALAERFTPADQDHMLEAVAELELAGLITVAKGGPSGVVNIRPDYALFWRFDRIVFNYDTDRDAAFLIGLILDDELRGVAKRLHQCIDWSHRRFNPAFARVVEVMPKQRVSQEVQSEYPTTQISVMPEDRVRLKRLLASLEANITAEEAAQVTESDFATAADSVKPKWWRHNLKWKLGLPGFMASVVIMVLTAQQHKAVRDELNGLYPRMEELIAVYSLVGWRHPQQQAPYITQNHDYGGGDFELECDNFEWRTGGETRPGALFDCFLAPRTVYVPEEGAEVDTVQVVSNEDIWYFFSWRSLFAYDLDIMISPAPSDLYDLRNTIQASCVEETGDPCGFTMYAVRIDGLSGRRSVEFLVSSGSVVWHPNGTLSRRDRWVVHMGEQEPIGVESLNKFIQLALRQSEIDETDLAVAVPKLQTLWYNKDAAYAKGVLKAIETLPELSDISKYLTDPP